VRRIRAHRGDQRRARPGRRMRDRVRAVRSRVLIFRASRHHDFDIAELSFKLSGDDAGSLPLHGNPGICVAAIRQSASRPTEYSQPRRSEGQAGQCPRYQRNCECLEAPYFQRGIGADPSDIYWRIGGSATRRSLDDRQTGRPPFRQTIFKPAGLEAKSTKSGDSFIG
jgi:hypothetical protein